MEFQTPLGGDVQGFVWVGGEKRGWKENRRGKKSGWKENGRKTNLMKNKYKLYLFG